MLTLSTLKDAESFVSTQKSLGNDVRWDNYDIIFFRPSETAVYSKDGARRNGSWGFENRSNLNNDGTWSVDYRNVRKARRNAAK